MNIEDIQFRDQRALGLIIDLALLLGSSASEVTRELGGACARAAITNSTLLVECCANSCLLSLSLPARLLQELDKLPAISKLDYFLFAETRSHIDRGCRETELAADALRLRDHIVHPKPKLGSLVRETAELQVDYGASKALGVPYDVREWDYQVAVKVARVVLAFLNKFFLDWCKLDKGRITTLLVVRENDLIQRGGKSWVTMRSSEEALLCKYVPGALLMLDIRVST